MLKISCFGASVTKQKGYVDNLIDLCPSLSFLKFGYGSMHLGDAGLCFLEEVISKKPDICLLDWFSTFKIYNKFDLFFLLDSIVYKLLINNIQPVFLILPALEMSSKRLEMYENIKQYSRDYNLHFIDIYDQFLIDNLKVEDIIRDTVHTNERGSFYYANIISNYLKYNLINFPDEPLHSFYNRVYPSPNKYENIKKISQELVINNYIKLKIEDELIGILQRIGPYSDSIDIINLNNNVLVKTESIWDVWCYYERENIKISIKNPGLYLIKLNQNFVDKTKCKNQLDWKSYKNVLNLKTFYYIGDFSIIDYE